MKFAEIFRRAGKTVLPPAFTFIIFLGAAGPCRADDWTRMQDANRRAQQASTAAGSLCPAQSAAKTQIQNLAHQVNISYNTFQQRLQDNLINDVQSDSQHLTPLFQVFQSKAAALQQLRGTANVLPRAIESAPGFDSSSIAATPEVMRAVREMLDHARTVHDAIEEVMEENQPLMSFAPRTSYAQWMAIANNKQDPAWYQARDQRHVTLQDNLDTVMRQAYTVYGNRTYLAVTPQQAQIIHDQGVELSHGLGQLGAYVTQAQDATQEILTAMNAYPGIIRQHRATLTQEAENKAGEIEAALRTAQGNCTFRMMPLGDGTVTTATSVKALSAQPTSGGIGVLSGVTQANVTQAKILGSKTTSETKG